MFFKGTKNYPHPTQIEKKIERLGGYFNGFTTKEFTYFYIKLLRQHTRQAFEIIYDAINNSLFLPQEIEKEKQVIGEEIKLYHDAESEYVKDLFEQCLYRQHPLARSILGTYVSIGGIIQTDLFHFAKKFLTTPNQFVAVAGGLPTQESRSLIETYFSNLTNNATSSRLSFGKSNYHNKTSALFISRRRTDQVQIALGVPAFSISDDHHYVSKIMAVLLGGNMSSRLFTRLREDQGLVYDVATVSEARRTNGFLVTYTACSHHNLSAVITIIIKEYNRLRSQLLSDDEIADAKNFLLHKKEILCENSDYIALDMAKTIIFDKQVKSPTEYQTKIKAISVENIRAAAQEIFVKERLHLVLLGPVGDNEHKYQQLLDKSLG